MKPLNENCNVHVYIHVNVDTLTLIACTLGSEVTEEGTKQMAMVVFGSRVTKVIDFADSHKGLSYIQDKILSVRHRRESKTSTATALNYVREAILGQVCV